VTSLVDLRRTPLPSRRVDRAPALVYGPVRSRRFGRSLGINLLPPGLRLCSFDCRYCQCGGARVRRREAGAAPFPSLESLEQALAQALAADPAIDDICFAGSGEPTLYPRFREAVLLARALRDRSVPWASVSVLSNGVAAGKAAVRGALALADRAVLKLDAARDDLLRALDGAPHGLSARRLVQVYGTMIGIETQSILVRGDVDNAAPDALDALGAALRFIHPRRAGIGTITRAPGDERSASGIRPLASSEIDIAVARLRRAAPNVEIVAY
jgi:wyosine [tRNA(Phe)-imidazoG37] synthetase (radical SAM superfamily)